MQVQSHDLLLLHLVWVRGDGGPGPAHPPGGEQAQGIHLTAKGKDNYNDGVMIMNNDYVMIMIMMM